MGYAPTGDADDADYDRFLSKIQRAAYNPKGGSLWKQGLPFGANGVSKGQSAGIMSQSSFPRKHQRCTIVLGDWNASVGTRLHPLEPSIGAYGYGNRNRRGDQLVSFCQQHGWDVASTFCKQRSGRKWTWRSPNGITLKEYDLFLVRRTTRVRNVHVINQFNFRSDHRLVRLTLDLEAKFPRRRQQATQKKMNWPLFRHGIQERREAMEDPDPTIQYRGIREVFDEARAVATERIPRAERLSANTRDLFDQRRVLLAKADIPSRLQLVQTNKSLRIAIASDIEKNLFNRYHQTLASKRLFEDIDSYGRTTPKEGRISNCQLPRCARSSEGIP